MAETIDLDMLGCSFIEYTFEVKRGPETPDATDNLTLSYWNQSSWIQFHQVLGAGVTDAGFINHSGTINNADALHSTFRIQWDSVGSGAGTDDFFVDDLEIHCRL